MVYMWVFASVVTYNHDAAFSMVAYMSDVAVSACVVDSEALKVYLTCRFPVSVLDDTLVKVVYNAASACIHAAYNSLDKEVLNVYYCAASNDAVAVF